MYISLLTERNRFLRLELKHLAPPEQGLSRLVLERNPRFLLQY
jgi:hypothetical protein